jgi:hypothetical protein
MDFYLESRDDDKPRLVRSATAYSYRNGLQIYWGISNFGFGDFSFYIKEEKTFCHNEACGPKTVGTVLKKAVWDMIYKGVDVLTPKSNPITREEAQSLFAIGSGGFRIYRNAHSRAVIDSKLYVCYFEKSNLIKTTLVFDNKTFPDLIDEGSADFVLSEYLEQPQWDCFIEAFQTEWVKTTEAENFAYDDTANVTGAKFVKAQGEGIELHWESNKGSGRIAIENHPDVQVCVIDTSGKSKQFVMNILDKAMEGVTLHDV